MKLAVNQQNALKLLADAFSNRSTFITELLQNARRAGATLIDISTTDNGRTLLITDNGCGVSDFSKLMTLCDSGWGEDVQESDAPYGVGFLSAILSSVDFTVTSNGHTLSATTSELLNGDAATLSASNYAPEVGTTIVLNLKKPLEYRVLQNAALAFPVDIQFNGTMLSRPLALDKAPHKKELPGIGTLVWTGECNARYIGRPGCALQGLPIRLDSEWGPVGNSYSHTAWGLHLDSSVFRGRMPDRESVIGDDFAWVKEPVKQAQRQMLRERFEAAGGAPHFDLYVMAARENMQDLIDSVTEVPKGVFHELYDNITCIPENVNNDYSNAWDVVHKSSMDSVNLSHYPDSDSTDYVTIARVLADNNVWERAEAIPAWLRSRYVEYDEVKATPVCRDPESLEWVDAPAEWVDAPAESLPPKYNVAACYRYGMTVQQCDAVRVDLVDYDGNVIFSTVETHFDPLVDGVLYLTRFSTTVDSSAFMQTLDVYYDGDNERWDYDNIEKAVAEFNMQFSLLLGADPVCLLEDALNNLRSHRELSGKSYTVSFQSATPVIVAATECEATLTEAVLLLDMVLMHRDAPDFLMELIGEFLTKDVANSRRKQVLK